MPKLIMLKGLPASGKTTWAKEFVASANKNAIKRVNKDDLRSMLDNQTYSRGSEEFVLNVRNFIVEEALKKGKHVVVDDTNLVPKHEETLRKIAKACKADFVVKEFDVDVGECVKRDSERKSPVGAEVIWDMYNRWLKPDKDLEKYSYRLQDHTLPRAIICDLDGTLAIRCDRAWNDVTKVGGDSIHAPVEHILKTYDYANDVDFIFLSGREGTEEGRDNTVQWLSKVMGHDHFHLFMRPAGDYRKDSIVKRELFEKHVENKWYVNFVLDDRNQVVDMWRNELRLPCFQVAPGDF